MSYFRLILQCNLICLIYWSLWDCKNKYFIIQSHFAEGNMVLCDVFFFFFYFIMESILCSIKGHGNVFAFSVSQIRDRNWKKKKVEIQYDIVKEVVKTWKRARIMTHMMSMKEQNYYFFTKNWFELQTFFKKIFGDAIFFICFMHSTRCVLIQCVNCFRNLYFPVFN